ncbi:carboxylate-amine ligase [Umezawaea beigongshangensis]|uniref:carboxylate-amine ligase n=1 Tax=Umezawaea beigongshangensis TaxID=2780383 RepID=UPI0018F1F648|nr:glutamate--cysteine ligase [Umezawaea beigongshangensis]
MAPERGTVVFAVRSGDGTTAQEWHVIDPAAGGTVGVEEEFLLVDPRSGRTAPRADEVLGLVRDGALTRFHGELAATQVEAATGPCVDLDELRSALGEARGRLTAAAGALGLDLVPLGAPPEPAAGPVLSTEERFGRIADTYAAVVEDYEACGCHVHVGVPDAETAIGVLNHLRPWLPTLLALSANSPRHGGRDTGYASWRAVQQSRFPGFGVQPWFDSAAEYDAHVERMVECGVLVDRAMSFWLVRRSPRLPTVEFRVADTAREVEDAVVQAALSRALVRTALTDLRAGREAPRVRDDVCAAAVWSAARYGLGGVGVHPLREQRVPATTLLGELVAHVTPALEDSGDTAVLGRIAESAGAAVLR